MIALEATEAEGFTQAETEKTELLTARKLPTKPKMPTTRMDKIKSFILELRIFDTMLL
jgi:hypothetical protein